MEACLLLREYLFDKWQITMIQAVGILQNIQKNYNMITTAHRYGNFSDSRFEVDDKRHETTQANLHKHT